MMHPKIRGEMCSCGCSKMYARLSKITNYFATKIISPKSNEICQLFLLVSVIILDYLSQVIVLYSNYK